MKALPLILSLLLTSSYVLANDTAATVGAGGIVFKKNLDLSMDEEELKISVNCIDVKYVFTNHSKDNVTETFAFPLPKSPRKSRFSNWDESAVMYRFMLEPAPRMGVDTDYNINFRQAVNNAPFLDFTVYNDGHERAFNYQIRAHDQNGKDITDYLLKEKIPLSASYLTGYLEEPPLERMPELKAKLATLKLLGPDNLPNWTTTTTYFWEQWFSAKSSRRVSHRYTPGTGYHWMTVTKDAKGSFQGVVNDNKLYHVDHCIDQATLARWFKDNATYKKKHKYDRPLRVMEVDYIVTTANNWRGPIGKFSLEIEAPKGMTAFTCFDGSLKRKGSRLATSIKNFAPSRDLQIAFIGWAAS